MKKFLFLVALIIAAQTTDLLGMKRFWKMLGWKYIEAGSLKNVSYYFDKTNFNEKELKKYNKKSTEKYNDYTRLEEFDDAKFEVEDKDDF